VSARARAMGGKAVDWRLRWSRTARRSNRAIREARHPKAWTNSLKFYIDRLAANGSATRVASSFLVWREKREVAVSMT